MEPTTNESECTRGLRSDHAWSGRRCLRIRRLRGRGSGNRKGAEKQEDLRTQNKGLDELANGFRHVGSNKPSSGMGVGIYLGDPGWEGMWFWLIR